MKKSKAKNSSNDVKDDKQSYPNCGLNFICDVCGIVKHSKALIRHHVESHLNLSCMACYAILSSRSHLKQHLSKHFKLFVCQHCGKNFNFIEKLKKHLREAHDPKFAHEKQKLKEKSEVKGTFPCRFCPHKLNNKTSLTAHEYRLHRDGKSEIQFICNDCGKGFYTKENHRLHSFEHFTGKIRYCEFAGCRKFFKSGKLLGIHKKTHEPPKHECVRCKTKFVQNSGLLKHNKRFCKYLKQPKSLLPDREIERIAETAKLQFERLRVKKVTKVENFSTFEAQKILKTSNDKLQNLELNEHITEESSLNFLKIDIKEETVEKEESENDTWCINYEYLDEAIVKFEDIVDEYLPINLDVKSMDQPKEKVSDVLERKKPRKSKKDGNPRKLYNEGKRRKVKSTNGKRKLSSGELFSCDLCGKSYSHWMSIFTHVTIAHKTIGDLPCEFCQKLFKSSGNLKRHVDSVHKKIRCHVCHVCAFAFNSNSKLTDHLKIHEEPELCKTCGKFVKNIVDHMKRHNRSANKTFLTCQHCGKLYDKNILQVHIDRVHAKSFNGKIFRCDDCDVDFTRRDDWRQHNYANHFQGEVYQCGEENCGKYFRTKKLLRYHGLTHEPPGSVDCNDCGKKFSRKAALYKHRKLKHPEIVGKEMIGLEIETC